MLYILLRRNDRNVKSLWLPWISDIYTVRCSLNNTGYAYVIIIKSTTFLSGHREFCSLCFNNHFQNYIIWHTLNHAYSARLRKRTRFETIIHPLEKSTYTCIYSIIIRTNGFLTYACVLMRHRKTENIIIMRTVPIWARERTNTRIEAADLSPSYYIIQLRSCDDVHIRQR